MVTLPPDSRCDLWRTSGWQSNSTPPATQTFPSGTTALLPQRWKLNPGDVIQGTLGDFGYPKTVLLFPTKSLYALFGLGTGGGWYGYSWAEGLIQGVGVVFRDCLTQIGDQPSPSHFGGKGWNVFDLRDSLISNVHGVNCDNFIFLRGSHSHAKDCTVQVVDTDFDGLERTGLSGHYAFKTTGDDCVFERCRVLNTKFQHDFSVELGDRNAFVDCAGVDSNLDQHANKEWCHDTLFYKMNLGNATRPYASGGNAIYLVTGPHHQRTTLVDIRRGDGTFLPTSPLPKYGEGTQMWTTTALPAPPSGGGVRVKTLALVNVRQAPSKTSALLGTQATGKQGVTLAGVIQDPVAMLDFQLVNFDTGVDGYVDAAKLVIV